MSLEIAPFDESCTSSYRRSIVTLALSCTISETKRNICRNSRFSHTPPAFDAATRGLVGILPCRVWYRKIRMIWKVKKFDMCSRFDTIPACDRQTYA